mmetsp:Transcript_30220/g.70645  ORF Transcript_30220/g.70645 Transcript_30220/m.70645 type:complete len:114 (-) Transcript_30220:1471-1812(-)
MTLLSVQDRLTALEQGGEQYQADRAAVHAVEARLLQQLRDMQAQLSSSTTTNGNASSRHSTQEVERLRDANRALHAKLQKLDYRISHMVGHMERLYEENQQLKEQQQQQQSTS